jgi:hypothetical protein
VVGSGARWVAPKQLASVLRFRNASELWTQDASLTELAPRTGYFTRKLAPSSAGPPAAPPSAISAYPLADTALFMRYR